MSLGLRAIQHVHDAEQAVENVHPVGGVALERFSQLLFLSLLDSFFNRCRNMVHRQDTEDVLDVFATVEFSWTSTSV